MRYEFEWEEMDDRERRLWRELMKERQVRVNIDHCPFASYPFMISIWGEPSRFFKNLGKDLKEKFSFITIPKDIDLLDNTDSPISVQHVGSGAYTVYAKDIQALQPVLDLLYKGKLTVVEMNQYFNLQDIGEKTLKLKIEKCLKIWEKTYGTDRSR